MNNWQLLKARWKSETTKFWKRVMKIFMWVVGVAGATLAADLLIPNFDLPNHVNEVVGYIAVFGGGIMAASKFTTKDPELSKETPK